MARFVTNFSFVCVYVFKAFIKSFSIAAIAILFAQTAFAEMRDRVSITADNNVVTDSGQPLRGAPFFLDLFSIFETDTRGGVVGGMQANEDLYREYFGRVVRDYNMNAVRISPWIGVWETMQVEDQFYESHQSEFIYMVDTVVDWAEEEGIYAIVNLHTRFGTDATLERMIDFWDIFAPRYKDKTHVIYELTNEPKTQYWTDENIVQRRININDPSLVENYDPNTLIQTSMAPLCNHVRGIAPDTHLILWSPNNPSSLPLEDIQNNSDSIDYSNASVGFHIYEFTLDKKAQWDIADSYRENFPAVLTEFYSLTRADNYPIDYAHLTTNLKTAEERGYSWIQWAPTFNYANLNQQLTHDDVKFSQKYKDAVENNMYAVFDSQGNDQRNSEGTTYVVNASGVDENGNTIAGSVVRVNEAKTYWALDNGTGTTPPPTTENVAFGTPAVDSIDLTGNVSLPVDYVANSNRDVVIEIFDADFNWLGSATETVQAGSGTITINVSVGAITAGTYQLKAGLRAVGGDYTMSIKDVYKEVTAQTSSTLESVAFGSPTIDSIDLSGNVSLQVDYTANTSREVVFEIFDADSNWLAWGRQTVQAGSGSVTMNLSAGALVAGTYNLKVGLREVNGDYTTSVQDVYKDVTAF